MKKRLIFTLLYERGTFVLSRNFRTQKIGNIEWLNANYNFSRVARYVDELVLINVSQDREFDEHFRGTLSQLLEGVFAPVTVGGGIQTLMDAETLFDSGADKILLNRAIHEDLTLIADLATKYGQQAVVGSLDIRTDQGTHLVMTNKASTPGSTENLQKLLLDGHIGELYVNSVNKDGTGQGMDPDIVDVVPSMSSVPIILAGGAGKPAHLAEAIATPRINAVATANLLNFVGDGLEKAREEMRMAGVDLAHWI